ncbi:uncharacterized protein TRIADDRAFT_27973, partial [Trichoplax adhaerens]
DTSRALAVLSKFHNKLKTDGFESHAQNLSKVRDMLQHPVFGHLLNMQSSMGDMIEKVCICDEPTSHMPTNMANENSEEIESVHGENATEVKAANMILPSMDDHDFQEAMQVAAQGRMIEVITLLKPPNGSLGFSVVGLNSESHGELGIFIQEIFPEGIAAVDRRLQESDQILAINKIRIDSGIPHHEAIKLLQQASGEIELVIARGEGTESPSLSRSSSIMEDHMNEIRRRTLSTTSASSQLSANIQNRDGPKWRQLELITLYNDGSGLGCGIIGGRNAGVLVKSILKGLAADRDQRLRSGDQLLQIDDVALKGMSSEQVAGVFKQCTTTVNLIVSRKSSYEPPLDGRIHSTVPLKTYDMYVNYTPQDGIDVLVGGYIGEQISEQLNGLFVIGAADGDITSISSKLNKNDQIVKVNGITVVGESALTICDLLRNSGDRITLTMADSSPDIQVDATAERYDELATDIQNELISDTPAVLPPDSYAEPEEVNTNEPVNLLEMRLVEAALSGLKTDGRVDDETLEKMKAKWQEKIGLDKTIVVAELCDFDPAGGLGISIEAKSLDTESPEHFIRSITENGIIDRNGVLMVYDKLLEVNGNQISGLSDKNVIEVIRCLPSYVYIVAARELQPIEETTEFQTAHQDEAAIDFSFMDDEDENDSRIQPPEITESTDAPISRNYPINRKASLEQFATTARWKDKPMVIELAKEDHGLGFSLLDYFSVNLGSKIILIRNVIKGGVADTDGRIQPGDRLISVNGKSLENASLDYAVEMLKSTAHGIVRIGITKPITAVPQRMSKGLIMESVPENAIERSDAEAVCSTDTEMTEGTRNNYRDKRPTPLNITEPDEGITNTSEPVIPPYVEYITIDKGKSGLGLNIMCDDYGYGAVIKNILPGGAVENDSRLEVGDIIMVINNKSVIGLSSIKSRAILRRCTLHGDQISFDTIIPSQHETVKDARMPDFSQFDASQEDVCDAADTDSAIAVMASAETYPSEEFMDDNTANTIQSFPFHKVVELYRDPRTGLGIGIAAGSSQGDVESSESIKGVFIRQIKADSPAGRCGMLMPGDRLLQVNHVDVSNATHEDVINVIRNSPDPVRIVVQSLIATNDDSNANTDKNHENDHSPVESMQVLEPVSVVPSAATLQQSVVVAVPESVPNNEDQINVAGNLSETINDVDLSPEEQIMEKYDIDRGDVFIVQLFKGSSGLGISITEKKYQDSPRIFVANVKPDGPAGLDGQISRGDELLEVNDAVLRGKQQKDALTILKGMPADVKLIIYRPLWEKERRSSTLKQEISEETPNVVMKNSASSESLTVPRSRSYADLSPAASPTESTLIVTLIKDRVKGLGVAVGEPRGIEKNSGHYVIKNIAEGGVAARDGRLKVGDRLLAVNRKSITGLTYQEAIEALKEAEGAVTLTVLSTNSGINVPISPFATLPRNLEGAARSSDPGDSQKESTGTTPTNASPAETPIIKTPPIDFDDAISLRTCPVIPGKETAIEIDKGDGGLGITIIGGANTLLGATVIYKIYEDGAIYDDGRLQVGDHILEVNGVNLRKADHDAAITALRIAPPVVKLLIFRENADTAAFRDDILDVFTVELRRSSSEGLGFSIIKGGTENEIFISDIVTGGLAEKDGRLLEGDQIVAINGIDVQKQTHLETTKILRDPKGTVRLTISRLKAGSVAGSVMSAWPSTSSLIGSGLHSSTDSLLGTNLAQKVDNKVKIVQLFKRNPQDSLGLSFSGGAGSPLGDVPVTVVIVRPGGLAAQNGEIKVNDQILKINGQNLDGLTDVDVVKMLKKATGTISLQVLSPESDKTKTRISSSTSSELVPSPNVKDIPTTIDTDNTTLKESRQVILERGVDGLGFSIVGGNDSVQGNLPIFIKQVFPWGAASRSQELKAGDQLISANGHSLLNVSHEEAVNILKGSKGSLVLTISS